MGLLGKSASFLSIFFPVVFLHSYSLATSPTPTAANPWGLVVVGTCSPPSTFYGSPDEAVEEAKTLTGGKLTFNGANADGSLGFGVSSVTNPNCFGTYAITVGYAYTPSEQGTTCPDTNYVQKGMTCQPYNPPPESIGKPDNNNCPDDDAGSGEPGESDGESPAQNAAEHFCGDPIDVTNGNVFEEKQDYSTAGMNHLRFTRYYNSLAPASTNAVSLGKNWRHSYDRYIKVVSTSSVILERADGRQLSFTLSGGHWVGSSDTDMTLTQNGNGTGSNWVLIDRNDTQETYNQITSGEAILTSVVARNGYTQTLTRNSASQLTRVADSYNRQLNFTYNGNLLSGFTTADGLLITYNYNSSGLNPGVNDRLTGVSSSVMRQSYGYTGNFYLASITDENGNQYASWTYDSFGRGLSSQHAGGADKTTISYTDGFLNLLHTGPTVTGALGQQEKYDFVQAQGILKVNSIARSSTSNVTAAQKGFGYDSNGYISNRSDWNGDVINYVNNSHGLPTTINESDTGGVLVLRSTGIVYDTKWVHLPATITLPRKTVGFNYDGQGNVLTRTETDSTSAACPANCPTRKWSYTYDSTGHVLSVTAPRTDVVQKTTYTYNGNNIATITNALGQVIKITSYTAGGLPLSAIDANGVVSSFGYDARNRLTSYIIQAASGNSTTLFTYDNTGNITKIMLPDGSYLNYSYDVANRVTSISDAFSDHANYTYDADSNIAQAQWYNPSGQLTRAHRFTYDTLGRLREEIGAVGQVTGHGYDNNSNTLAITNPLGNQARWNYDAFNRLTQYSDPLNAGYNFANNTDDTVSNINFNSLSTAYSYDGFGRIISVISPETGTTNYTLDAAGNRVSETDARGIVTTRTFDALNRVSSEHYPNASENVTYYYDASSGGHFMAGRLAGVTDESGSTFFDYNERGDVVADSRVIGGSNYQARYGYDLADRISSMTYPSGHIISISRDTMGRVTGINWQQSAGSSKTALASNIWYLGMGAEVTHFIYGNGLVHQTAYDQDLRPISESTAIGSQNVVQNLSITYDAGDNVTTISDWLDGSRTQNFTYDKDYRLLTATGKYGSLSYSYDAVGNRTKKTEGTISTAYNYQVRGGLPYNLLSNTQDSNVRNFTYTPNGNFATDSGLGNYTWNNRNHLAQAVNPGNVNATYQYNAFGQRTRKSVGNVASNYVYDQNGHLIAEYNGSALIREYVYFGGQVLAQIEANGTIYYVHNDHLGTPQKMTDANKNIVWDRIQKPFGETFSITGSVTNNLRFAGQYFDAETGLNYNYYRYYDSTLGRYIAADPIGFGGGYDLYSYVGNNPLRWVDETGKEAQCKKDCEKQAEEDEEVCRKLLDASVRSRCWQSVQARYGACIAKKLLPPLVTNMDFGTEQTPNTPTMKPPSPWLVLPLIPFPGNPLYAGF